MKLRKDQLLIIGIVAVVMATFILVFYLPQRRELIELQTEHESTAVALERDRQRLVELAQLRGEVARMEEQLGFFNKRLPDQEELGQFIKDASGYAQVAGLEAAAFEPQKISPSELYLTLPIEMKFKGSFLELFRFLRQAKNMTRLTHIRSLNVKNSQELTGQCGIDLVMNIYFTRGQKQ